MNKKYKSGFTLIELLVVIAIIGILSSVVLVSLNTARTKGADAAVKSNLTNIRAQAEIIYDDNGGNYTSVCANTATIQKALIAAARAGGASTPVAADFLIDKVGRTGTVTCHSRTAGWAAEAPLKTIPTTFWCVDSLGTSSGQVGGTTLPADDITCGL